MAKRTIAIREGDAPPPPLKPKPKPGSIRTATRDQIEKAWANAKQMRGKDKTQYRQDPYGNTMNQTSYGKTSAQGWEVDHIKPKARGGSDDTRNLQALNTKVHRAKGDSLVKRSRHSKR